MEADTQMLLSKLTAVVEAGGAAGEKATVTVARHIWKKRISKWERFLDKVKSLQR